MKQDQEATPVQDDTGVTAPVRQVLLTLGRIDPWSVLKISFLLSVAFGVASILATILLWVVLDLAKVWSSLQIFVGSLDSGGPFVAMMELLRLPRVAALATMFAVINIFITTAIATIGAVLHNLAAGLVGGVRVTLTDD